MTKIGHGAVVVEVVVGGVEADAAQVGDEGRRVERVVLDERGRQQVPAVEHALRAHREPQQRAGQAQEPLDLAIGGGLAARAPSPRMASRRSTMAGSGSPGRNSILVVKIGASRSRRLLGAEREPDAAPVVESAAGDEAVEARELRERDADARRGRSGRAVMRRSAGRPAFSRVEHRQQRRRSGCPARRARRRRSASA